MVNIYEQQARERKVTRLVDALDAHLGRRATRADLDTLAERPITASNVCHKAGISGASQATVEMLVKRIEARDAKSAEVANG